MQVSIDDLSKFLSLLSLEVATAQWEFSVILYPPQLLLHFEDPSEMQSTGQLMLSVVARTALHLLVQVLNKTCHIVRKVMASVAAVKRMVYAADSNNSNNSNQPTVKDTLQSPGKMSISLHHPITPASYPVHRIASLHQQISMLPLIEAEDAVAVAVEVASLRIPHVVSIVEERVVAEDMIIRMGL